MQHANLTLAFIKSGWIAIAVLIAETGLCEIIPIDRRATWDRATIGVPGGIPVRTNIYTTLTSPTVATINSALKACPANSVVQLGSGTVNVSGMIDWTGVKPGVVLCGIGPKAK